MSTSDPKNATESNVRTNPREGESIVLSTPLTTGSADSQNRDQELNLDTDQTGGSQQHTRLSSSVGPNDLTIDLVVEHGATSTHIKGDDLCEQGDWRNIAEDRKLPSLLDYEFLSEIARGGMGVVYRARERSLNRIVAIKMILAGQFASEDDVQRFRSEAEAAANLQHPNIVAIYEIGEFSGRHFFSMQFVQGRSFAEAMREKILTMEELVQCVRVVAEAVEYAHSQGVLHRDIKPSNILIDTAGIPHLTDFGLAKRLASDTHLTVTGTIMGTPSYMPPEQASGEGEIDRSADVYSLGAVLYEILTGRPPFVAQKATDVLLQVLNNEPVSPRLLNPSVPKDLSTVCLKCLEKATDRRYSTAHALSADLGRWLDGEPIEARPIGRTERTWRWCRRNPLVASLAAMLVIVFASAFIGITSQWLVAQSALIRMQEAQVQRAATQVDALLKAAPESLQLVLGNVKSQYEQVAPELLRRIADRDLSDRDHLRLSLALLPSDPNQVVYLRERMLSVELGELLAMHEALSPFRDQLREDLWRELKSSGATPQSRFSAALMLARWDADDQQHAGDWQDLAPFLATRLLDSISVDPSQYESLVETLRPVRHFILPYLETLFRDQQHSQSLRTIATNILVSYTAHQPVELAKLLVAADPWQFLVIRPRLAVTMSDAIDELLLELDGKLPVQQADAESEVAAKRRANAAVALLQLGVADRVWPLLVHSETPRVRAQLIELFWLVKTDPGLLVSRLTEEPDVSARRAILLGLGSYPPDAVAEKDRKSVLDQCVDLFTSDPDAGIHAACEWLVRRWDQSSMLSPPEAETRHEAAQWWIGPEGMTFAVIDGKQVAVMGSQSTEEKRSIAEQKHSITIGRKFAMGTKEVTIDQFRRFIKSTSLKMPPLIRKHSPEDTGPMITATWYRAAQYCRWISEQAGVREEQMCYPPINEIREGLQLREGYLGRTGFRLPTEAEWEFACRAGATTSRAYGGSEELLSRYAWCLINAKDRAWACGNLKPNDFGLFDMHGNVWEWCGDRWVSYWEHPQNRDTGDLTVVDGASNRVLRGGSFDSPAKAVRSAFRDRFEKPHFSSDDIGFRVACTVSD